MSEIILNDQWEDYDKEYERRKEYFAQEVNKEGYVFYNILNAISTLTMRDQAKDFETYRAIVDEGVSMLLNKNPVFAFPNFHHNANWKYWGQHFMYGEENNRDVDEVQTGEDLPF